MNFYKKYCPNVFVAACECEHKKGDLILVETKYGKENECIVHNFVGYSGTKERPLFCYSIIRADGFTSQERAKRRLEKISSWIDSANSKSDEYYEKSLKDKDFLSLAEPIKIGHHSESKHRRVIQQAQENASKSVEFMKKAKDYEARLDYWESMAVKIDLSMPESLDYFKMQLEDAVKLHKGLKDGSIEKKHSLSMAYANKKVKDLKAKYEIAKKLWEDEQ